MTRLATNPDSLLAEIRALIEDARRQAIFDALFLASVFFGTPTIA